jgi:hypothetical protein
MRNEYVAMFVAADWEMPMSIKADWIPQTTSRKMIMYIANNIIAFTSAIALLRVILM